MNTRLTTKSDGNVGKEPVTEDSAELKRAEADFAAADAEATAARAEAEAARARARLLRLRGYPSSNESSDVPESDGSSTGIEPPPSSDSSSPTEVVSKIETSTPDDKSSRRPKIRLARARRLLRGPARRGAKLRQPTKRGLALTAMSLVTIGALVVAGLIGLNHTRVQADASRANAFVVAARQGVEALTTLDYRNAENDVQRLLARSTGEFYEDFIGRSEDFTSVIEQSEVTTKGNVTGSAIESLGDGTAEVLVSATSEVTNAAGAEQEPRIWRLRVTVDDIDGELKISKVDFVP
ncbi:hypothetical protein [Rhodococcus sp. NPDC058521]|uniref:hypothetical protein n=1 Tax=Rhodococcus sp. NPDC058521 TaxID=3346536 RepID=UPI003649D000